MNNLSSPKLPGSQNSWINMPWGTFLFILVVFALATHLRGITLSSSPDAITTIDKLQGSNLGRIVALISLGALSLFNLFRSKPGRFQINGLLGWLILFYLVWAALSATWSTDLNFTAKRVGILLLLSLGALCVADRFRETTIHLIFFITAIYILHAVVLSFKAHIFLPLNPLWRFGGTMHPIVIGWHCGLLIFSAFALAKTAEKNRAVYLGIAFIVFLLLLLTRSRMAFASCIMGIAVYWGLTSTKRYQGVLFFFGIIIF